MAKKTKTRQKPARIVNNSSVARLFTNPLSLVLMITLTGLVLAGKFWAEYRNVLRSEKQFSLEPESLQMNAAPKWVAQHFHKQAATGFDWQDRSLLDANLVEDLAAYLERHVCVASVVRIEKSATGIEATLSYRQPIGMVQLEGSKLVPVDIQGIVLDAGDFPKNQINDYLRIAIANLSRSKFQAGDVWPDVRVVQAAEIARQLASVNTKKSLLGIYAFHPKLFGTGKASAKTTEFRLWTANRDEIIWGSAIGYEGLGEVDAAKKLETLKKYCNRSRQTINGIRASGGNVLDLRSGTVKIASQGLEIKKYSIY